MSIPSQTEMITTGKVVVPDNEEMETGFSLVEPSCLYLNSDRGIVGRTLVKNSSSIPIRLLNTTNKNITIHSGTTVGQLLPVEEILEGGLNDSEPCRTLPDHLEAFLKKQ